MYAWFSAVPNFLDAAAYIIYPHARADSPSWYPIKKSEIIKHIIKKMTTYLQTRSIVFRSWWVKELFKKIFNIHNRQKDELTHNAVHRPCLCPCHLFEYQCVFSSSTKCVLFGVTNREQAPAVRADIPATIQVVTTTRWYICRYLPSSWIFCVMPIVIDCVCLLTMYMWVDFQGAFVDWFVWCTSNLSIHVFIISQEKFSSSRQSLLRCLHGIITQHNLTHSSHSA